MPPDNFLIYNDARWVDVTFRAAIITRESE